MVLGSLDSIGYLAKSKSCSTSLKALRINDLMAFGVARAVLLAQRTVDRLLMEQQFINCAQPVSDGRLRISQRDPVYVVQLDRILFL